FGKNIFEKKRRFRLLNLFLNQLSSPLVVILLIAASVTFFVLKDLPDTIIIGLAVFINTVIGVIQEGRASRAFDALKRNMQRTARVLRGGILRPRHSHRSARIPADRQRIRGRMRPAAKENGHGHARRMRDACDRHRRRPAPGVPARRNRA
ncbi:hypothetical protein HYT05_01000, partial [Candidatus Kaiserbacteria bacterium]|nr:hypothetical protein [Candidatus Kaiserbacteria bacterium]